MSGRQGVLCQASAIRSYDLPVCSDAADPELVQLVVVLLAAHDAQAGPLLLAAAQLHLCSSRTPLPRIGCCIQHP